MGAGDVSGGTCSHGVWYLWRALVFVWDSPLWVQGGWGGQFLFFINFWLVLEGVGVFRFVEGMGTSL